MIVLKEMTWDNCFSYGDNNKIVFNKNNITQVIGKNGQGKSSIIFILQELLYGKNSKDVKKADISNRNTKYDGYNISLTFSVNNVEYKLIQKRIGAKVTLTLFKEDEDISEHTVTSTYKKVEQLIGRPFEDFCQIIYQSTETSLGFLKATDTTRKKFLISLLNLEYYSSLEQKIKTVFSKVSTQRVALQSALDTKQEILNKLNKVSLDPIKLQEEISEPENLREEIANLKAELKNYTVLSNLVKTNNEKKEKLKTLQELTKFEPDSFEDNSEFLKKEILEHTNIIYSLDNKLKELKAIKDICPTCKQKIEGIDLNIIQSSIESININKALTLETLESLKSSQTKLKKQLEARQHYNNLLDQLKNIQIDDNLPDKIEEVSSEKIKILEKELESINAEIKSRKDHNTKAEIHNSKIESIKAQKDEYQIQIDSENILLEQVSAREGRLEILKQAFGTKGIVAYKIEAMIKDLETLINQYLQEFSDGRFTIEFVINNDKLNVLVTDYGKEISLTSLSSGEMSRVNISTLLAIRKLLNSLSSNRINLLFLDEVLNVLDEEGKQILINVLEKEEDLNSFIVSHGWSHPLVSRIKVYKEKEISYIYEDS